MRIENFSHLTDAQVKNRIEKMKNIAKVGIELEFYSNRDLDDTSYYIQEIGMHEWETVADHSLYAYHDYDTDENGNEREFTRHGAEVRLGVPCTYRNSGKILDQLHAIATDETLKPRFDNPESGGADHEGMRGENHGLAGLHFHFGLSKQAQHNMLDLFRLAVYAKEHEADIERLAGRGHNRWCRKMDDIIHAIDRELVFLNSKMGGTVGLRDINSGWFRTHTRFHFDAAKYYGVNATNIGMFNARGDRKFNTVEFRWGASAITADRKKLQEFFDFLATMFFTCVTGEDRLVWHNEMDGNTYLLKDIGRGFHRGASKNLVTVVNISTKKVIGRLSMSELDDVFVTNTPNKIEEEFEGGEDGVTKFRSIRIRKAHEVIVRKNTVKRIVNELIHKDPKNKSNFVKNFKNDPRGAASSWCMRYGIKLADPTPDEEKCSLPIETDFNAVLESFKESIA